MLHLTFKQAAAVLAAMILSACAADLDPELREDPNYSLGYSDGCATANFRIDGFDNKTVRRNDNLYDESKAYQSGWRSGYSSCGGDSSNSTDVFDGQDPWR